MSLVQEWRLQVSRALGVSMLPPVVLIVAAALLAGGGLSGIGSITQVASGPDLPAVAGPGLSESQIARGDIVGAEPGAAEVLAGGPAAAGGAAPGTTAGAAPGGDELSGPVTQVAPPSSRPAPGPAAPVQDGSGGGGTAPGAGSGGGGSGQGSPLDPVVETGREVADQLPGQLGPVTNDLLDTLLGPPRQP